MEQPLLAVQKMRRDLVMHGLDSSMFLLTPLLNFHSVRKEPFSHFVRERFLSFFLFQMGASFGSPLPDPMQVLQFPFKEKDVSPERK